MSLDVVPFAFAHHMALIPLAWLAARVTPERHDAAWWWLAVAFGVSWLADTMAHVMSPWLVSAVYPVSQVAIVAAVFLPRYQAQGLMFPVVLVGVASATMFGVSGPDILLRVVAWGLITGIVWGQAVGRLRTALLVYFALGLLAWLGYSAAPGWTSWSTYQGVRALGIALFCWASVTPAPQLRLAR